MVLMSTAIEVEDLVKRYGAAIAVDGVSFQVERGEVLALLGPNGAGKSTTIEILEGYRHRTSGRVAVLGADPSTAGLDWRARIGIVLQSSAEEATAGVREQLAHFAAFYSRPRDVDEVLDAVGLSDLAGRRIRTLSGGQRRRLDVALGVIGRPDLLFLDEPTTGFDPEARRRFWSLVRDLRDEGTTILLTTHYLDEAAALGDRAAVIADGRLLDVGPIDGIGPADGRTPVVRWTDADGAHEQRTDRPAQLVAELVTRAGGEPPGVEIVRPSLEDVYLRMIERAAVAS